VFTQLLHDGSKEFAQNDADFSKYVLSHENKVVYCHHLYDPLLQYGQEF